MITGLVGATALTDGAAAELAGAFLAAGPPLPTAAQFDVVQQVVAVAMAVVGIADLTNLLTTIARERPCSWQEQLMHVMTIGMMGFCAALPGNAAARRQQLYAAALVLDPKHLEARDQLALALLALSQFELAANHFTLRVEQAPNVTPGALG